MTFFTVILILHITGGGFGLIAGSVILSIKKGNALHRRLGLVYYTAMLTASLSAFVLSVLHPNLFLFITGVFSAYLVVSGRRYIRYRIRKIFEKPDWIISACMLTFGAAFIGYGIFMILNGNMFGIVPAVFGSISLAMVYQDYRHYTGRAVIPNFWLTTHLQRMIGSYIASATAFLVVNNSILPGIVAWLLPTVILTPLIFRWTAKYRLKTAQS